jgi:hypothetical protein
MEMIGHLHTPALIAPRKERRLPFEGAMGFRAGLETKNQKHFLEL